MVAVEVMSVVEVVLAWAEVVVGSGWLSSIDNKVTFPWEAAWKSRGRPPSRAAGPPPLREETTEGHQPAGGEGGAGAATVKQGGQREGGGGGGTF